MLDIQNLHVSVGDKEIIHGINLQIELGKIIAIMGPNGSGKSTLANTIAGHPAYNITDGKILLDGEDITVLSPDKRAQKGLFLSMQYTPEIPGVTVANFLRLALNAVTGKTHKPMYVHKLLQEKMKNLDIDPAFLSRYLNVGFSGGEKKRLEILQLTVLNPLYTILDETDSGLDIDSLRIIAEEINHVANKDRGILLITHYNRILEYIVPDVVHIMIDGKIVKTGDNTLAKEIEENGYKGI